MYISSDGVTQSEIRVKGHFQMYATYSASAFEADRTDGCLVEADDGLTFDEQLQGPHTVRLSEEALSRSRTNSAATAATNYVEAPAVEDSRFQPGMQFGPYRLESKLGEGAMGIVFKATHTNLDKLVAIKFLPSAYLSQKSAQARFEREMKAVGRLQHANVVQAFDAGEEQGMKFLVMEYVEGLDLEQAVKTNGVFAVENACKTIYQAALGLQAAHEVPLVHRDIKPSNLFITRTGQIKILDLGLASLSQDDGLTVTGQCFGTPDFMAPEQWEDVRACDGRTDLYALGCTLFFLLVGHSPYGGDKNSTPPRIMLGHINDAIPDLRAFRPDVPPKLDQIYRTLMSKKAAKRYASAAELAQALAPLVSDVATIGSDAGVRVDFGGKRPSLASLPRRRRWLAIGGTIAAVAIIALTIAFMSSKRFPDGLPLEHGVSSWSIGFQRGPAKVRDAVSYDPISRTLHAPTLEMMTLELTSLDESLSAELNRELPKPERRVPAPLGPAYLEPDLIPTGPAPLQFPATLAEVKEAQNIWAEHLNLSVAKTNSAKMELVFLPPGEVSMGSAANQRTAQITQALWVGKYEVLQSEYRAVMGKNPARFAPTGMLAVQRQLVKDLDPDRLPVDSVSWIDAIEFCNQLSAKEGLQPYYKRNGNVIGGNGYRLLTDAEWEYACRAGTQSDSAFGPKPTTKQANILGRRKKRPEQGGSFKENAFGLHDMHGNIYEWCEDVEITKKGAERVRRGGSFNTPGWMATSFYRTTLLPTENPNDAGFRIARTVDLPKAESDVSLAVAAKP